MMPASIILETDRLALRELDVGDAAFILRLVNEPAWLRFIGDRGIHTLEAAQEYVRNSFVDAYRRLGFGLWLVERKEDSATIGICGLIKRETLETIDLGFAFHADYWKKGYAFEAATATMSYARQVVDPGRIAAIVTPENEDSKRLLEKLGFRFERKTRLSDDAPEVMLYAADL